MSKKPSAAAPTELAAAPVNSTAAEATVFFESVIDEPIQYDVCGIRAHRDPSGKKCRWRVPASMVDRFSRHSHVVSGRVKRIEIEQAAAPTE